MRKNVGGLFLIPMILVVAGCAKKVENPRLVGPTYERLWQEGWSAYKDGDYGLAEEKFDTILTLVTTADPYVHVAKAFAALPQGKISVAESEVGLAVSLRGNDPFHVEANKPLVNVVELTPGSLMVRADFGEPFIGFAGGIAFGLSDYDTTLNGWKVPLRLGPQHNDTFALQNGFVPFGFQGSQVSLFLWEVLDSSVVLMLPDSIGTVMNQNDTIRVPNVLAPPDTVLDTIYFVPGDTLILDTNLVYRDTVPMFQSVGPVFAGDTVAATFLARTPGVPPDTIHVLAYLLRSAAEYAKANADLSAWVKAIAYAHAAEVLVEEMGLQEFTWDPLGDGSLSSRFSLRRALLMQARGYWMMNLYKNAARKVNEIYGDVQIPPDTLFTPDVIQRLSLLIEQAESI